MWTMKKLLLLSNFLFFLFKIVCFPSRKLALTVTKYGGIRWPKRTADFIVNQTNRENNCRTFCNSLGSCDFVGMNWGSLWERTNWPCLLFCKELFKPRGNCLIILVEGIAELRWSAGALWSATLRPTPRCPRWHISTLCPLTMALTGFRAAFSMPLYPAGN